MRQIQQEGATAQALERGIEQAAEIFAQEQVVKSNYDLIDADQELVRALQELGNQLDQERFEADKERQIRGLESRKSELTSFVGPEQFSDLGPINFTKHERELKELDAQIKDVRSETYKSKYNISDPKQSNFIATQQQAEQLAKEFQQIFSSKRYR